MSEADKVALGTAALHVAVFVAVLVKNYLSGWKRPLK